MKKMRDWRTRTDSFAAVWPEMEEQLREAPGLEALTLFEATVSRTVSARAVTDPPAAGAVWRGFLDPRERSFSRRCIGPGCNANPISPP